MFLVDSICIQINPNCQFIPYITQLGSTPSPTITNLSENKAIRPFINIHSLSEIEGDFNLFVEKFLCKWPAYLRQIRIFGKIPDYNFIEHFIDMEFICI